eukprot:4760283-Amphidinium_carterae.1
MDPQDDAWERYPSGRQSKGTQSKAAATANPSCSQPSWRSAASDWGLRVRCSSGRAGTPGHTAVGMQFSRTGRSSCWLPKWKREGPWHRDGHAVPGGAQATGRAELGQEAASCRMTVGLRCN